MKELLQLRKKIKEKKPDFIRQDAHKKAKIGYKWRRPKGIDSKMRLKLKGYRRSPSMGWGSPKKVRGLHKSGLKSVVIHSIKEIEKLNPTKEGIVIASGVGMKKRISFINKAKEKNIRILNIKNVQEYLENVAQKLKKRKKKRKDIKKRGEKVEKKKGKEKAKDKLEDKIKTEEEKKEEEKKEKDKILTKKQM